MRRSAGIIRDLGLGCDIRRVIGSDLIFNYQMIDILIPVQVVKTQLRLSQRDRRGARKRDRGRLRGSRAMDMVNVSVCISSCSFCVEDQVIVRRCLRIRGRRGVKGSGVVEGQYFGISVG